FRSGITQHSNDFAAGSSADNGVVNHNYSFALEHAADRVVFKACGKIANRLAGLDECPAYIVAADESDIVRDSRLTGISDSGRHATVRNGDDNVGFDRVFDSELHSKLLTKFVNGSAVLSDTVRTGE